MKIYKLYETYTELPEIGDGIQGNFEGTCIIMSIDMSSLNEVVLNTNTKSNKWIPFYFRKQDGNKYLCTLIQLGSFFDFQFTNGILEVLSNVYSWNKNNNKI